MADTRIKLITEQDVKDITDIPNNVDGRKFANKILVAQDKWIKSIVGTDCYADLLEQYDAGTLTAANTTLLDDYLKYVLAWYTLYLAYPNLLYSITPTAVHKKSDGNNTPIDKSELGMLRQDALTMAEYYADQAICFIRDNTADYPCYKNNDDCCNKVSQSGFGNSGISLDDPIDFDDVILTKQDLE